MDVLAFASLFMRVETLYAHTFWAKKAIAGLIIVTHISVPREGISITMVHGANTIIDSIRAVFEHTVGQKVPKCTFRSLTTFLQTST